MWHIKGRKADFAKFSVVAFKYTCHVLINSLIHRQKETEEEKVSEVNIHTLMPIQQFALRDKRPGEASSGRDLSPRATVPCLPLRYLKSSFSG